MEWNMKAGEWVCNLEASVAIIMLTPAIPSQLASADFITFQLHWLYYILSEDTQPP